MILQQNSLKNIEQTCMQALRTLYSDDDQSSRNKPFILTLNFCLFLLLKKMVYNHFTQHNGRKAKNISAFSM